jgi:hypothetical protein
MRLIVTVLLFVLVTGCGPRDPGTASEAEAEALNKAAAELEAQAPPAAKLNEK